ADAQQPIGASGAWASYRAGEATNLQQSQRPGPGGNNRRMRMEPINFEGKQICPVRKAFAFEHPAVKNLGTAEVETIRLRLGINCEAQCRVPNPVDRIEDIPFPDHVKDVLRDRKFAKPTPIQAQAWPAAIFGHDVIGVASTGTGKTLAYVLPMITHIQAQLEVKPGEGPIGLVVVPSRELCRQVAREIEPFLGH
ncbi:unnamed protein product, partial [Polarella glacialis]